MRLWNDFALVGLVYADSVGTRVRNQQAANCFVTHPVIGRFHPDTTRPLLIGYLRCELDVDPTAPLPPSCLNVDRMSSQPIEQAASL